MNIKTDYFRNTRWRNKDILRLKGAHMDKLFIGPKNVAIGITRRCNLTCKYCLGRPFIGLRNQREKKPNHDISFELFKEIIDDCSALGVENITLCGGEPSLHPLIKKMIDYINGKRMLFSINTNGTFDKYLRGTLLSSSLLNINISETNDKDYQMLQGGDKRLFNKVLNNIRYIGSHKTKKKPIVIISFILNRYNFNKMDKMINLAQDIGANSIQFKIMRFNKKIKELAITFEESKEFKETVKKIIEKQEHKKINTNIRDICSFLIDADFNKNCETLDFYGLFKGDFYFHRDFSGDFGCYYGWFSANIGPWGDVFLCCTNRLTYIGNIYNESFKEIWNSPYAHRIRLALKHNFNINKTFWKPCIYCANIKFNTDINNRLTHLA